MRFQLSGDTGTSLAELSRSDKRRALAANRLIAQSSQNDPKRMEAACESRPWLGRVCDACTQPRHVLQD